MPYLILCLSMAIANCSVPMMGTVTLQNTMICCNALPMQYAHTNTHNTHTHQSKPTQTTYAHWMHHTYLHTSALLMLCNVIATATVAPLYISSATSEIPHWTTPHHLPHPSQTWLVYNSYAWGMVSFQIIIRVVYYASHQNYIYFSISVVTFSCSTWAPV